MGLHRYDTRTKALTFVMDANDVIVLNKCKKQENRDNLVVRQHRYFILGGSYDWYWLFDPTGQKEKGPIGVYEDGEVCTITLREVAGLIVGLRGQKPRRATTNEQYSPRQNCASLPTKDGWKDASQIDAVSFFCGASP